MIKKSVSIWEAFFTFTIASGLFFVLLVTLLPYLRSHFHFNSAVPWFITGFFVFIPLLAYALIRSFLEGNTNITEVFSSLGFKSMSRNDWKYVGLGTLFVFLGTGIVFGLSALLTNLIQIRPISTTPWFMTITPFHGTEQLLLLVWLPMFLLNIFGEEILWRGFIQNRLNTKYAWILIAIFWAIFHLSFGLDLMLMLIPCFLIVPYAFEKTRNTWVTILIHGLYNGPTFVLVALGVMKT